MTILDKFVKDQNYIDAFGEALKIFSGDFGKGEKDHIWSLYIISKDLLFESCRQVYETNENLSEHADKFIGYADKFMECIDFVETIQKKSALEITLAGKAAIYAKLKDIGKMESCLKEALNAHDINYSINIKDSPFEKPATVFATNDLITGMREYFDSLIKDMQDGNSIKGVLSFRDLILEIMGYRPSGESRIVNIPAFIPGRMSKIYKFKVTFGDGKSAIIYPDKHALAFMDIDDDFNNAIETAWLFVKKKCSHDKCNIRWSMLNRETHGLNGKSIGLGAALALKHLIMNKPIDPGFAVTGVMDKDGKVIPMEYKYITEKLEVCERKGLKLICPDQG